MGNGHPLETHRVGNSLSKCRGIIASKSKWREKVTGITEVFTVKEELSQSGMTTEDPDKFHTITKWW
jgi:hypothetical protein